MTNSAAPQSPPALRDIKPPVEILDVPRLIVICLLCLALAIGCYYLIKWLLRKKVFQAPVLSPREKALGLLNEAEKLVEQPVPFVTVVTGALRGFFEEEHGLHAPHRTTEEFLTELSKEANLEAARPNLVRFLDQSDLVKFAKLEPSRGQLEELLVTAKDVIQSSAKTEKTEGSA